MNATRVGLENFGPEVATRAGAAAIGTVSSWLSMELGEALGLEGFGAELFSTVGATVTNHIIGNLLAQGPNFAFAGISTQAIGEALGGATKEAIAAGNATNLASALASAVGAFIGARLGAMVVSPQTQAAVVLSSVGSAVGAYIGAQALGTWATAKFGSTLGNMIAPGIGAFVGFVLGALIGNLFGRKQKPKIPTANASTYLSFTSQQFELGSSSATNGGNLNLVVAMATSARDTLNGFVAVMRGDGTGPTSTAFGGVGQWSGSYTSWSSMVTMGHTGAQLWFNAGAGQVNVASADIAVEKGILAILPTISVVGGDLLVKRAIGGFFANGGTDLTALMGDLQIASDYRFYGDNRELINGYITDAYASLTEGEQSYYVSNKALIDKLNTQGEAALTSGELGVYNGARALIDKIVAALEAQAVANPWIITLQRVTELGLDKFRSSDFNGGLQGFLSSFDLNGHKAYLEDVSLSRVGNDLRVALPGAVEEGLFSLLGQASVDGRSVDVTNFFNGNPVGYVTGDTLNTAGRDFIDRSAETVGVTITDYRGEEIEFGYWQWVGPGPQPIEEQMPMADDPNWMWVVTSHSTAETGGDDIFLGGWGNDVLEGHSGWDWLAGNAGNDILYGGDGNDALLGGTGADTLIGDAGADYLAGGADNDVLSGGANNDTLVGGAGVDYLDGGAGDDVFLVDQDGVQDTLHGGDGVDLVSFERWTQGAWVQLGYVLGTEYDLYTGIEGIIGSQHADAIWGGEIPNYFFGGGGDDTIDGGEGYDFLEGGSGADTLTGGDGIDTASYESSRGAVFVDLAAHEAFGGDASGDVLWSIENLRGSRGADELKGDTDANLLEGKDGDDWLIATGGADVFDGGNGADTVDYSGATAGVVAWIGGASSTGYGSGGLAAGHTYISVEAILGSDFGDYLSAGAGSQSLMGAKGNDVLAGSSGADTYYFALGDGVDNVSDDNLDDNVVSFGGGVGFNNLAFGFGGFGAGGYLDIHYGSGDMVRIAGNFGSQTWQGVQIYGVNTIETLDMNGAGQLDLSTIMGVTGGTTGGDTLYGYYGSGDLITGHAGNDVINGSDGSGYVETAGNVIIGGAGDDYIITSGGDDQFAFERGSGRDTITDAGGEDTLVFGPNVAADDVIYKVIGNDLYVGIAEDANPAYEAHQVADYVRVVNGAIRYQNVSTGAQSYAGVELINAGGSWIDLRKLGIDWVTSYTSGWPPIVLDLDGDGLDLIGVDDSLIVSKLPSGHLARTSWVGPTDGFLAVDRDGDGQINRTSEISFLGDKEGAKTDLEGLQAWDTNGDGKITNLDDGWSKLKLWVDANQNGRSTSGELRTLDEIGIIAINLTGTPTGMNFANVGGDSFVHNTLSFTWASGATGQGYDVELARKLVDSEGLSLEQLRAAWGEGTEDSELGRLITEYRLIDNGLKSNTRWRGRTDDRPLTTGDYPYEAIRDIELGLEVETVAEQHADVSDHDNLFAEELARQAQRRRQPPQGLIEPDQAVLASLGRLTNGIDRPGRFDRPFRPEEGSEGLAFADASNEHETFDPPSSAKRARGLDPAGGSTERRRQSAFGIDLNSAVELLSFGQDGDADPWAAAPVTLAGGAARVRWWGESEAENGSRPSLPGAELVHTGQLGAGLSVLENPGAANLSAHQKLTQAMAAFGPRTTAGAAVWKRSGEMETVDAMGADTGSSRWRFGAPARIPA